MVFLIILYAIIGVCTFVALTEPDDSLISALICIALWPIILAAFLVAILWGCIEATVNIVIRYLGKDEK